MIDLAVFLQLMDALDQEQVAYVLVGGLALFAQGLPRVTDDIDIFIETSSENLDRLKRALGKVYADPCVDEIQIEDVAGDYGGVVRYGPPVGDYVVDIMGRLGEAWSYEKLESEVLEIQGVRVRVATPRTLVRMKRDTVRLQDRADAAALCEKFHLDAEV